MPDSALAIPILPSRSLPLTLTFYQRLGFSGTIHPHGQYAILSRGSLELHFHHHPDLLPETSSAMCYLRVPDVNLLFSDFSAANLPAHGIPRIDPLSLKPWGMLEFAIVDPDGTLLRIGQPATS